MAMHLSDDGQHFVYACPHCGARRSERVDRDLNPWPFEFMRHCSCGRLLDIDYDFVIEAQKSYNRAKSGRT